jgi:hypothetical protein
VEKRFGRRQKSRAPTFVDEDASGVDEDETRSGGGQFGGAARIDRMKDHAPRGLAGYGCDTLSDDLRVSTRGGEDLFRLQRTRRNAQPGNAAKSGDEQESDQRPPASVLNHCMVPEALRRGSASLTSAGTRSCYRN